jgi:hypothetical protein
LSLSFNFASSFKLASCLLFPLLIIGIISPGPGNGNFYRLADRKKSDSHFQNISFEISNFLHVKDMHVVTNKLS